MYTRDFVAGLSRVNSVLDFIFFLRDAYLFWSFYLLLQMCREDVRTKGHTGMSTCSQQGLSFLPLPGSLFYSYDLDRKEGRGDRMVRRAFEEWICRTLSFVFTSRKVARTHDYLVSWVLLISPRRKSALGVERCGDNDAAVAEALLIPFPSCYPSYILNTLPC